MLRVIIIGIPIYLIIGFIIDFWVYHGSTDEPYKMTIGKFIDNVLQWPKILWRKLIN